MIGGVEGARDVGRGYWSWGRAKDGVRGGRRGCGDIAPWLRGSVGFGVWGLTKCGWMSKVEIVCGGGQKGGWAWYVRMLRGRAIVVIN